MSAADVPRVPLGAWRDVARGRQRRLLWGWLQLAGRLMPGGRLARREAELVILRVAALLGVDEGLAQHRRLGRRGGQVGDEVAVAADPAAGPPGGLTARERLLLRAADELVDQRELSDALWTELGRLLDEQERIELVVLVAHCAMLATMLRTSRAEPARPR